MVKKEHTHKPQEAEEKAPAPAPAEEKDRDVKQDLAEKWADQANPAQASPIPSHDERWTRRDLAMAVLGRLFIEVKAGEEPSATAEKVMRIADELYIKMNQRDLFGPSA